MTCFIWRRWLIWGGLILLLAACGGRAANTLPPATPTSSLQTAVASPTHTPAASTIRQLTILYTNDEHGWMAGVMPGEGAANLMGLWRELEGYSDDGSYLILSGGDLWTGPAISTWFEGESMAEVMNAMGYAATAVGNHEFDFGLDTLQTRITESTFPFLSANMRRHSDGAVPTDLGIQPYTLIEANGIQVGIIGLTTISTPRTTNPVNVAEFEFIDYETALREIVPEVKNQGAELILVPAHVCQNELEALARNISDLGIQLLGGGHCNELFAQEVNHIVLLAGGSSMGSYARATFQFDTATDRVVEVTYGVQTNMGGTADPLIEAIVNQWQARADAELNLVIGYTTNGLARRSQAMQALMTESWLIAYPTADVAITNLGGMRAALPPGEVTLADIIGVMPFNNVIVEVRLTGQQLLQVLAFAVGDAAVGGVQLQGTQWVFNKSGAAIDANETYSLLVNDFMYAGGDGYELLAEFDPAAYNTAIDWRQPVIDWIMAQASSAERPLDEAIEQLGHLWSQ